jgi:dTDP-4-dehydrorhamnose reductase/dTDP-4-dehydrorhamnose 3,5-epimerase-like enzyme
METIPFDLLHSWWGGKVKVRKMKPYEDSRGLLGEIIRPDSDSFKHIVNTYISETKPFIQRGPHEHNLQDDDFISWNSHMMYEFFDPASKETKYFITEPKGIYSLFVEHGIHHGYRNLDANDVAYTLNSLNRPFKGFGRNDEPDEIRHEKKTVNNKILFIFGAGGRLGKALTETAFAQVGEHSYDIIPYFGKLLSLTETSSFFKALDFALQGRDVTFINCAALTNTKDAGPLNREWRWSNVELPQTFANGCAERNWKFVQLSTDYVYQEVKEKFVNFYVSTYTQSKKEMEGILKQADAIHALSTTVLRVSNLFENSPTDENIFTRLTKIIRDKGEITVDPDVEVAPTDVYKLSAKIIEFFKHDFFQTQSIKFVNIITPSYRLPEFVNTFIKMEGNDLIKCEEGKIKPWLNAFKTDPKSIKINLD